MRVEEHPILEVENEKKLVKIFVDDKPIMAVEGEPILAALLANNIRINRYTAKKNSPRGLFCGIGRCTDCVMVVNGQPNTRTCVTLVEENMQVETQKGLGEYSE